MNKLDFFGKNKSIELMNAYGTKKTPFLFVISFDLEANFICPLDEIPHNLLKYSIDEIPRRNTMLENRRNFEFSRFPIPIEEYAAQYESVMTQIAAGNTYLLNLTCSTPILTNLNLEEIYDRGEARYKLWIKDEFVVFSPETFISIQDGKITSCPMKGTIMAAIPDAANQLLNNPKELAEHYTIVDLIRNDLNIVAKSVEVEDFRYLELIDTNFGQLWQTSSRICGRLPEGYNKTIGDLLFKLLPAGSISGAPKEKTLEIIKSTESHDRNFYTGVFGYFDGTNLKSAVMIRFIEEISGEKVFKSGGGITSFSKMESEYMEMIDKVYVPFD